MKTVTEANSTDEGLPSIPLGTGRRENVLACSNNDSATMDNHNAMDNLIHNSLVTEVSSADEGAP